MEKVYSMIIRPPENISHKIINSAQKVYRNLDIDPHISLGSAFYCTRFSFIDRVKDWLEDQEPFVFTLRNVANFPNRKTVSLVSDNIEEIREIRDLYCGLNSLLIEETKRTRDRYKLNPHLTLGSFGSIMEAINAKSNFRQSFDNPIPIPITKIDFNEKNGNERWEIIDCFQVGSEKAAKQLVTADEYGFNQNNRASIASACSL